MIKRIDTRTLRAVDDEGREVKVTEFIPIFDAPTFGDPGAEEAGVSTFKLLDGSGVRKISATEFVVMHNNKRLRVKS
jgi:hypothetical protein